MEKKRADGEGSIYQLRDGRFAASMSLGFELNEDGKRVRKRVTVYGATREEAHENLTDYLKKKQEGKVIPTGKKSVGEFLDDWLEQSVKPALRPRTYASYEEAVRLHLKPGLGHVALKRLTGKEIQKFLNQLAKVKNKTDKEKKLSPRTVAYSRAVLRAALAVAVEWELIASNPASIRMSLPKSETRKIKPLTREERQALVKAVEGDDLAALFMLLLYCGLRKGEALGLSWSDVDLEGRKLHVRQQLQRINKALVLDTPKTEKSMRELTIPERVIPYLRKHRTRQGKARLEVGSVWEDSGLVFTTAVGSPVDPRNVKRVFDRLLRNAKLPHRRLHDLRHEFASNMLACGVDLKVVSDSLGHSKLAITADTYAHVSTDLIREAIDKSAVR